MKTSNVQIELLKTLEVGQLIHWLEGSPLTVMAVEDKFIIASNADEATYSIIDLERRVAGASDRVFDMFDYHSQEGVEEVLKHLLVEPKFKVDYTDYGGHDILKRVDDQPDIFKMEVSRRNSCDISEAVDFKKTFE